MLIVQLNSPASRDRAAVILDKQPTDGTKAMWIVDVEKARTKPQNKLLWLWVTETAKQVGLTHGIWHTPLAWKLYICKLLLGEEEIDTPDGPIVQPKGTSTLSVKQMTTFLNEMRDFVGAEYGVQVSEPEDLYQAAMGRKAA